MSKPKIMIYGAWLALCWFLFIVARRVESHYWKYRESLQTVATAPAPPATPIPAPSASLTPDTIPRLPIKDNSTPLQTSTQEQKAMSDKKTSDSAQLPSINQTMTNSPFGSQSVTINPSIRYIEISGSVASQLESSLSQFKSRYTGRQFFISVDPENGSSTRNKVAGVLGQKLSKLGLGRYEPTNTYMGNYPDHPTTIVCHPALEDVAHSLAKAVSVYIGMPHVQTQGNLSDGYMRLYLYAQPQFRPDGSVIFE